MCPDIGFPLALLNELLFGLVCPDIGFPLALLDELLFGLVCPGIGFPLAMFDELLFRLTRPVTCFPLALVVCFTLPIPRARVPIRPGVVRPRPEESFSGPDYLQESLVIPVLFGWHLGLRDMS